MTPAEPSPPPGAGATPRLHPLSAYCRPSHRWVTTVTVSARLVPDGATADAAGAEAAGRRHALRKRPVTATSPTALDGTIDGAVRRLVELQDPGGWWVGELESNVDHHGRAPVLPRVPRDPRRGDDGAGDGRAARAAAPGRPLVDLPRGRAGPQRDDGGLCGAPARRASPTGRPSSPRRRSSASPAAAIGGARVFTRIWFALFGLWPWEQVPQLPGRAGAPPPVDARLPLHVRLLGAADGAAPRGRHALPAGQAAARRSEPGRELDLGPAASGRGRTSGTTSTASSGSTRARPSSPGVSARLRVAERWIVDRQELDGCWGGIQPPWVWSLIALACRGHGWDSPVMRRGLDGWSGFLVDDGDRLRPEACQSPVWDTGLAPARPRRRRRGRGPPAVARASALDPRRGGPGPGRLGGARSRASSRAAGRSSTTTTSTRTSTTRPWSRWRCGSSASGVPAVERACRWIAGMQCANGGWGAFDVDNDDDWLYDVPFCDFGAVIDPPSVDVTGARRRAARRRSRASSEPCGAASTTSCASRRRTAPGGAAGASTTSTAPAPRCPALEAAGLPPEHPAMRRGVAWLEAHPERGRRLRRGLPLVRPRRGRGAPGRAEAPRPPSQTAWALMGLVAAGEARSEAAARAAAWLCEQPARGRRLGRGALHGHRLPARLPHPLPPVPDRLAADRARSRTATPSAGRPDPVRAYVTGRDGLRRRPRRPRARRAGGGGARRAGRSARSGRARAERSRAATPSSTSRRCTATTPIPRMIERVNVEGTRNVVDACVRRACRPARPHEHGRHLRPGRRARGDRGGRAARAGSSRCRTSGRSSTRSDSCSRRPAATSTPSSSTRPPRSGTATAGRPRPGG